MTFIRYATLGTSALISGPLLAGLMLASSASAVEDDFHKYNQDAMDRHDAAMYQLVDDLSACAGYYSMLTNRSGTASPTNLKADEHRADFLALGADALTTLVPGPRSTRLLEMEARIISSHRSLLNTFGSLGGSAEKEIEKMTRTCERLRNSKRRVFGWTRISAED